MQLHEGCYVQVASPVGFSKVYAYNKYWISRIIRSPEGIEYCNLVDELGFPMKTEKAANCLHLGCNHLRCRIIEGKEAF